MLALELLALFLPVRRSLAADDVAVLVSRLQTHDEAKLEALYAVVDGWSPEQLVQLIFVTSKDQKLEAKVGLVVSHYLTTAESRGRLDLAQKAFLSNPQQENASPKINQIAFDLARRLAKSVPAPVLIASKQGVGSLPPSFFASRTQSAETPCSEALKDAQGLGPLFRHGDSFNSGF